MLGMPSRRPKPTPLNLLVLAALLALVIAAIACVLQFGSNFQEFQLPIIRGRTVVEHAYMLLHGAFWMYASFHVMKEDVARYWAERHARDANFWANVRRTLGDRNSSPNRSAAEFITMFKWHARVFAVMAFLIGAVLLAIEGKALFVQ